jgi:hypothetical protein
MKQASKNIFQSAKRRGAEGNITPRLERAQYNQSSLRLELNDFEQEYKLSCEEFMAYGESEILEAGISGFDRHVWASSYRDWLRLKGGS